MFFDIEHGKLNIWAESKPLSFLKRLKTAYMFLFKKNPPYILITLEKDQTALALQSILDEWLDDSTT